MDGTILGIKVFVSIVSLLSNVFVITAVFRDKIHQREAFQVLARNPTFQLLAVLFSCHIIDCLGKLHYEQLSQFLGYPVYGNPYTKITMFVANGIWFLELFLLQIIALSHVLAVYKPVFYTHINRKWLATVVSLITAVALLTGAVPLLLPNMGLKFYIATYSWYEDLDLPGMRIHIVYNWILQVITIATLLISDVVILYKLFRMKSCHAGTTSTLTQSVNPIQRNTSVVQRTSRAFTRKRISLTTSNVHITIALNFILLSSCLFMQTIIYNTVPGWRSPLTPIILALSPLFRTCKCWVYTVFGRNLRMALGNTLKDIRCALRV